MPDLRRFGATLSRILPFLAQEKAQRENIRRWLESNLQELAAREASEGRTILAREASTARGQARGAAYNIEDIFGKGVAEGLKGKPGAGDLLAQRLRVGIPGSTAGIVEDPNAAARINEERTAVFDLFAPTMNELGLPREQQAAIVNNMPEDELRQYLTSSQATVTARGGQALTGRGYDLEERGLGYRERELGIRERELKGGGAKDAAAVMKEAQNDREAAIKQYAGVGAFLRPMPEAQRALTASIKNANRRIDAAAVSAGIESPIKKPQLMFKVGLSILSSYATKGELPSWYDMLFAGYDPDFVFGLQNVLEKPATETKGPDRDRMQKAFNLLQAILEGKAE